LIVIIIIIIIIIINTLAIAKQDYKNVGSYENVGENRSWVFFSATDYTLFCYVLRSA